MIVLTQLPMLSLKKLNAMQQETGGRGSTGSTDHSLETRKHEAFGSRSDWRLETGNSAKRKQRET